VSVVVLPVVAAMMSPVVAAALCLPADEYLTVVVTVTLARMIRIELAKTAGLRLFKQVPKGPGARDHYGNVRSGESSHRVAAHAAYDDRVEGHAGELHHRAALTMGMVLVGVAENFDLGGLGVDQAEERGTAEVSEHLGLDALITPCRHAYAHLLHPS
jgi:hypothetical protein